MQVVCSRVGLKINFSKTEVMTNLCMREMINMEKWGIGLKSAAHGRLKHVFTSGIPTWQMKWQFDPVVLPVFTYGWHNFNNCISWTKIQQHTLSNKVCPIWKIKVTLYFSFVRHPIHLKIFLRWASKNFPNFDLYSYKVCFGNNGTPCL